MDLVTTVMKEGDNMAVNGTTLRTVSKSSSIQSVWKHSIALMMH